MSHKKADALFWPAVIVGAALILFPEPVTTATGLAIVAGAFALKG